MTFHHGDRVRMGWQGPKGVVLRCAKRDGSGHYFKIKLDRGEWVWPERITVIDSEGQYELRCQECDGLFRSDDIVRPICSNCDRRLQRPDDDRPIRNHRAYMKSR